LDIINNSLHESLTRPNITVYVKTKSCLILRIFRVSIVSVYQAFLFLYITLSRHGRRFVNLHFLWMLPPLFCYLLQWRIHRAPLLYTSSTQACDHVDHSTVIRKLGKLHCSSRHPSQVDVFVLAKQV